jgi:hypothetical protein
MILIYRDPEFMMFLDNACHHNEYNLMSCIGAANRTRRGVCTDFGSRRSALSVIPVITPASDSFRKLIFAQLLMIEPL